MKKLSIIIPILEVDQLLVKTLDSIKRYESIDIIVKSKSPIDESLQKYLESQYNVKLIYLSDAGVYEAFNQALEYVETEYILFMGAGDVLVNGISHNELGCHDIVFFRVTNEKFGLFGFYWNKVLFMMPHHQGVVMRLRLLKNLNFISTYKIAADLELLIRAYKGNATFKFVDKAVAQIDHTGLSKSVQHSKLLRREVFEINKLHSNKIRNIFLLLWYYLGMLK